MRIYSVCFYSPSENIFTQFFFYTNDENPGNGARDLAILLTIICPPFKLITALLSGSESV